VLRSFLCEGVNGSNFLSENAHEVFVLLFVRDYEKRLKWESLKFLRGLFCYGNVCSMVIYKELCLLV
jgi:hypothetical protein